MFLFFSILIEPVCIPNADVYAIAGLTYTGVNDDVHADVNSGTNKLSLYVYEPVLLPQTLFVSK